MKLATKSLAFHVKAGAVLSLKSLAPFQVKATDDEARTFTGLASTWDVDLGGDRIMRGAFKDTLEKWRKSGRIMPLLDSHNAWGTVENVVGKMLEAKETADGLEATFQLLEDDRKADAVYTRLKAGYVDGLSIGYRAIETREPDEKEKRAGLWRIIKELELMEVSVVLWPMNPDARVDGVKGRPEQMRALLMDAVQETTQLLRSTNPSFLTEEDRKGLRDLAGSVGPLVRPPAPATPPAPTETDEQKEQKPQEPEAPAPEADSQKAEDQSAPEKWQIEALQERLARLNANRRTQGDA